MPNYILKQEEEVCWQIICFSLKTHFIWHSQMLSLVSDLTQDHFAGLNMKVCVAMGVLQLLVWAIWAGVTRHPSRWKLWFVVVGGGLAMLLEIYDFPPYQGFVDAHALGHATTIPSTYLWWSFIRDDAEFRTSSLLKKIH